MPKLVPMRLLRIPEPFDRLHWIFEPKLDGFRALRTSRASVRTVTLLSSMTGPYVAHPCILDAMLLAALLLAAQVRIVESLPVPPTFTVDVEFPGFSGQSF